MAVTNIVKRKLAVHLQHTNFREPLRLSQGDILPVEIELFQKGTPVSETGLMDTSSCRVRVDGVRADGVLYSYDATPVSDSVVVINVDENCTEVSGNGVAELVVEAGSEISGAWTPAAVLYSANFNVIVEEAPADAIKKKELDIDKNGTYSVAGYAKANVNVEGASPEGTKVINANGLYNVAKYALANVFVESGGGGEPVYSGFIFPESYGAEGDGETDDTEAIAQAVADSIELQKTVVLSGTYLIDGITATDVDIMLTQNAKLIRKTGGNDPFIKINTDRPDGHITTKSYIRGGTIDANEAQIAIAVNGSEQLAIQNVEIRQCHTGLYIGYAPTGVTAYSIESRVDNVKFLNKLNLVSNPSAYVDSVAVMDTRTDSQYSNVIIENFHTGMRVGGNAEINNSHHWISREEIFDGSVTFRVEENVRAFFTDCCSDSVETFFYCGPYSGSLVKGASQVRSQYMTSKTRMNYLVADSATEAEKTLWFFSYASAHRGHPSLNSVFYEVSDNVLSRFESQGAKYDQHVIIEGAAFSNFKGGQNNLLPFGYNALGTLRNFMGYADSNLYSFDFNDITENGAYAVQMQTSTNGPDGVTSGISNMIVSGHSTGKMQLLVNNTHGVYYRFYNGTWQAWKVLSDVIQDQTPAIKNFSGISAYTWLMNCNLDSVTTPGMYGIQVSTASSLPTGVTSGGLTLWVGGTNNEDAKIVSLMQVAFTKDAMYIRARRQITSGYSWTAWTQIGGGTSGKLISNCVLNSDYTLTINYTDGTSDTTGSIRGEAGTSPTLGVLENFQGLQSKSWKGGDLNLLTDTGMYAFNPVASSVTNKPTGITSATKANLWVGGSPNAKCQLCLSDVGIWLRFYAANTSTWTEWVKMAQPIT